MPGPANAKKRKKAQAKKAKKDKAKAAPVVQHAKVEQAADGLHDVRTPPPPSPPLSRTASPIMDTPRIEEPRYKPIRSQPLRYVTTASAPPIPAPDVHTPSPPRTPPPRPSPPPSPPNPYLQALASPPRDPFNLLSYVPPVEDRGDGPRVRHMPAFLASRICAPPSLDDALCAAFAAPEVREMLAAVLPAETALIVWYNRSRRKSRVCPACKRLYHLGDTFDLNDGDGDANAHAGKGEDRSQRRAAEQRISGICSALCFVLAACRFPGALRSTWGRMAEELSDAVWDELGGADADAGDSMGLGMMLRMTRCHDLGLAQLFFPGADMDGEGEDEGA